MDSDRVGKDERQLAAHNPVSGPAEEGALHWLDLHIVAAFFCAAAAEINFEGSNLSLKNIIIKTLGFTYLNPHVYSDTVFFLNVARIEINKSLSTTLFMTNL